MDIIFAMDENGGIGLDGKLPWKCRDELKLFKFKTFGHILVVGRSTFDTLPSLDNRIICCLSKSVPANIDKLIFNSIEHVLKFAKIFHPNKKIFIGGGSKILHHVFDCNHKYEINQIHQSVMTGKFKCDTFVNIEKLYDMKNQFDIIYTKHDKFNEYVWTKKNISIENK